MLSTLIPAGITSLPMPSPAMTAMRYVFMDSCSRLADLEVGPYHGNVFRRSIRDQVLDEPVPIVHGNHLWLHLLVRQAERHDDHLVARVEMPRRGSVDDDLPGASRQA